MNTTFSISHIPQLENDETLYSLYATVHAMSGNVSAERSSLNLLGVAHAARQHDIPPRVEPAHFGLPDEPSSMLHLLRHHTIASFYLPFLSREEQSQVAASWKTHPHARRRCDGSSRTIRPRHPLKACLECEARDKKRLGRAYWHVEHQWPLSMVCVAHHTSLFQFEGMHKRWLLPGLESLRDSVDIPPAATQSAHASAVAVVLAQLGARVAQTEVVDIEGLREVSISLLKKLGVMHDARSARHSRLSQWFRDTETSSWLMRSGPAWAAPLASGEWLASQLWRQKHSHPVKWLVLWCAMSIADRDITTRTFEDALRGRRSNSEGQRLLFSRESERYMAPAHVVTAFARATSYAEVMLELRASRGDVVRWLEADPALRKEWRDRLRKERLAKVTALLTQEIRHNSRMTRREFEREYDADVRWLRQHAPNVLLHFMKQLTSRSERQLSLFPIGA